MKHYINNIFKLVASISVSATLGACGGGTDGAPSGGASADTAGAATVDSGSGSTVNPAANSPTVYSVGGSLTGLKSGTSLVLRNNGGDSLSLGANSAFNFATKLANAASYAVTVYTQPTGQKCTVTNATGTIKSANVTNVTVACAASVVATYSVGGSVSGLSSGASLVLRNNGGDNLTRLANGAFTFATKLTNAAPYAVTVYTQPVGQTCTLTNASGTIPAANVANVGVACVTSAPTAKVLFKSNFGSGVSLGGVRDFYTNGKGAWQDILGTDKETGYSWPITALGAYFSGIQLITVDPVTPSTIGNYIANQIRPVTGPEGSTVNELFQNVKLKGPVGVGGSQAPLIIIRPWTIGDVTNLYITYWFKYPAGLASKLDPTVSSGNWRTQFEFKTGGYDNTYGGDYRIGTNVMKGTDGALYWYTKGDNVANGPWPRVDYWVEKNMVVPVPVDKWFKFEVFWHRSVGSDGRYWAAVDGQVIADHYGPNMGDLKLPINRIMINNAYSGGAPTVESHSTGLEIWDGFPCGVGKSCYVAP